MRTKDRVREYAAKHPSSTVRGIQKALGLSSPSVVQFHMKVDAKDDKLRVLNRDCRWLENQIKRIHRATALDGERLRRVAAEILLDAEKRRKRRERTQGES